MGFQRGIQKEFSKGFSKFFFFFKKNERFFFSKGFCFCFLRFFFKVYVFFAKLGNHATRLKVRCAQWMMRAVLSWSDLGPRRLCTRRMSLSCLLQQAVMWPTVQQHYKGSTSTPPRVARLCQIREASLVALRKFPKNLRLLTWVKKFDLSNPPYFYPMNLQSFSSPLYHLQGELVSLSSVPILKHRSQSVESFTSQRFRPNSHSNFTSVLNLWHRQQFLEIPNLEWRRISCECVSSCDSLFVSLPLRALCCCLSLEVYRGW